jgi:hypothetical protein
MFEFEPDHRRPLSLAGLAATLLIVVVSFIVFRKFQVRNLLETCAMSGQDGCAQTIDRMRVSHLWGGG